jgi:hypothetical protein
MVDFVKQFSGVYNVRSKHQIYDLDRMLKRIQHDILGYLSSLLDSFTSFVLGHFA